MGVEYATLIQRQIFDFCPDNEAQWQLRVNRKPKPQHPEVGWFSLSSEPMGIKSLRVLLALAREKQLQA